MEGGFIHTQGGVGSNSRWALLHNTCLLRICNHSGWALTVMVGSQDGGGSGWTLIQDRYLPRVGVYTRWAPTQGGC